MKITNIYKKTAALFFLMAAVLWPAVDAWGQEYGDRYAEYNSVGRTGLNSVTASVYPYDAGNIFDGNDASYWIANSHVNVTFTFSFNWNNSKTFDAIKILGGGQESERPVSITFTSGSFTQTFDNLDTSDRNLTLYLKQEITTTSFNL